MTHGLESSRRFGYLETTGSWSLEARDTTKGNRPNEVVLSLDRPRYSTGQHFSVAEQSGELVLWYSIGDPFDHEFVEYRRVNADGHISGRIDQ